MYKKIFMGIAAAAALTLVSCSSDDLNSLSDNPSKNEAISFDGYLGRSAVSVNGSRGSVLDKKQLRIDGFGVFGNYSPTDGQVSNLFNNQKVTGDDSAEDKWKYDPVRYWPTQGHIDFLAYAPYADGTKLNNTSIDFTVSSTITAQKDLLWAKADGQTKENGKVTFKFAHALSRLGYTVKLKEAYSDATITLNKITLTGSENGTKKAFYKAGTIDLSKTSSEGLWKTSSADKQDFDWFSETQPATTITSASTSNPETKYLFVIPQDFSKTEEGADKLYVIVEYTITYKSAVQAKVSYKVSQPLPYNFLQGKAYSINLTIGLTPIEFDAKVDDWGNIEDKPITLE